MPSVPTLSDAYNRERKCLILYSGLLFGSEVAGLTFGRSQSSQLNQFIAFDNPGAVPIVLVALIVWSLFQITVEWFNCDFRRRVTISAQLDILSAIFLSIFTLSMFAIQRNFAIRLADQLTSITAVAFISCFAVVLIVGTTLRRKSMSLLVGSVVLLVALIITILLPAPAIQMSSIFARANILAGMAGAFIGLALSSTHTSTFIDTTSKSFWRRLDPRPARLEDEELKHTVQLVTWRLYYNPNDPDRSKIIKFSPNGKICEGANDNESKWRIVNGNLELIDRTGTVFSRFSFDRKRLMLRHTNDPDTRSLRRQYMMIENG